VRRLGALSASPVPALDCGAHLVVHSVHKSLSAATQTGMLHASHGAGVAFPRLDQALCRALDVLQSSSPSYLLLASLDAARWGVRASSTPPQPTHQHLSFPP
jgi:arginine decarboxylase